MRRSSVQIRSPAPTR